jgi:hypothetical protein
MRVTIPSFVPSSSIVLTARPSPISCAEGRALPHWSQFVPSRLVATRELHTSLKVVIKLRRLLKEQVAT